MIDNLKREFLMPNDEYTPIPFWFWNDDLKKDEIIRQIHDFRDKGVMGFVIHPRIGIPCEIEYLSDRYMELVKCAVEEASRLGMKVVLYDEAMYPSGSAHGMVVSSNKDYASKGLKLIEYKCSDRKIVDINLEEYKIVCIFAVEKISENEVNPDTIVRLEHNNGKVKYNLPYSGEWSVLVFTEVFTGGTIRGIHFGEDDGEQDAPASGDILNPDAVKLFINLTHDRYYDTLKEHFGNTIIAMFTDEPCTLGRGNVGDLRPWTGGFLNWYKGQGGEEVDLIALWFYCGKDTTFIRKRYKRAINKRLELAYYNQISKWCEKHRIAFTGHPHESDDIGFLKYFHIPGQDVVWRWVAPEDDKGIEGVHSTMAKCSSDAARHSGRRRNANECFGCCGPDGLNWAFSVSDMKWYMDWLFVRGVNLLYPHAFFYSIEGRRSGERPPDVGPNNMWWKYYKIISNYIKRMSWLMTDSINRTGIAVLCEGDRLPWKIVKPLYENQIEFNYFQNDLLTSPECNIDNGQIKIRNQKYEILIVEDADILNKSIVDKIQRFTKGGGRIILYNENGSHVLLDNLYEIGQYDEVIMILDKILRRDVIFAPSNRYIRVSHLRKEEVDLYLVVNEGEESFEGYIDIDAFGKVEQWDPWEGVIKDAQGEFIHSKYSRIKVKLQRRESIIFSVDTSINLNSYVHKETIFKNVTSKCLCLSWKAEPQSMRINENEIFKSWNTWRNMNHFSGTIEYKTSFEVDGIEELVKLEIDLGEVHEIAHIYINDIDSGVKFWAPYVFDITKFIKEGSNELTVEVTNSIANKIIKSELKSGLLGPVRIIECRN